MHALYQRLKELDPDTFEKLCFHLAKEQHPGREVRHVDGSAGDDGIDAFMGDLDDGPTIWQCKCFPNGVGKTQREQIKHSLRSAMQHQPQRWILCVSVDLGTKAHRWFQQLAKSYAQRVRIGLLQASDLVGELAYRRTLLSTFFPHAVIDVLEVRQAMLNTGKLTSAELELITTSNVDEYLQRLQSLDPRFTYEVIFARDRKPLSAPAQTPGIVATFADDVKVINLYARDIEALQRDPPKINFTLADAGRDKFQDFVRTGRAQVVTAGEVIGFSSDFDAFLPARALTAELRMSKRNQSAFLCRVTFGQGDESVTYDLIRFNVSRAGTAEAEFQSTGNLPFDLSLTIQDGGRGLLRCTGRGGPVEVHEAQKYIRALQALGNNGTLELYDLERSKRFGRAHIKGELPAGIGGFRELLDDAVFVADYYATTLILPPEPTDEDARALQVLRRLTTGLELNAESVTLGLVKVITPPEDVFARLGDDSEYKFVIPEFFEPLVVFGQHVATGPVELFVSGAQPEEPLSFENFLRNAPLGTSKSVTLRVTGTVIALAQNRATT